MHAAFGILLVAATAQAWADVVKREPKVVSVNLEKRTVPRSMSVSPRLRRRQGSLPQEDLSHDASHGTYHLNATIGTPGQLFEFHLDTGSSDVWVGSLSRTSSQFVNTRRSPGPARTFVRPRLATARKDPSMRTSRVLLLSRCSLLPST